MKKKRCHFNVVLGPEPEGGFTALVPALPGCVTYCRTLTEARKMAKDAISGYIESLKKHGEPVPTDDETFVTSLDLEYAQTSRRLTARRHPVLGTKLNQKALPTRFAAYWSREPSGEPAMG